MVGCKRCECKDIVNSERLCVVCADTATITITRQDFRKAFHKGYSHEDGSTDIQIVERELFGDEDN